MNKSYVSLKWLCLIVFKLFSCTSDSRLLLFDASTPLEFLVSQEGGRISRDKNILWVETNGDRLFPGVVFKGVWNLSVHNQLLVEVKNPDTILDLPITVNLLNQEASSNPKKPDYKFFSRHIIPAGSEKTIRIEIPRKLPFPEVEKMIPDLRFTPYYTLGYGKSFDPTKVTGVAIYIERPANYKRKWGIKRIIAMEGEQSILPNWTFLDQNEFFPFIDKYGQFKHKEWLGKVKSAGDLEQDYQDEINSIAKMPEPQSWNKYGGWYNGPKKEAKGYFRVEKIDGKWWMVDPDGCLYWSHGPVRVTPSHAMTWLDKREHYFANLPDTTSPLAQFYHTRDELLHPYYVSRGIKQTYDFSAANIYRKYGKNWLYQYSDMVHKRLRSWGMNTIANGSDKNICQMRRTPYTDRIELTSPVIEGSHKGWWKFKDPFHPEFKVSLRRQLLNRKKELDDPWCFGFFIDNEISWGSKKTDLAEWVLQSPCSQPAKLKFIHWLKKKYGSIENLNKVWKTDYNDWNTLIKSEKKPPAGSKQDCMSFSELVIEEYFRNVRGEFKKIAPNKLYLGCRFSSLRNNEVLRIAAKYCDVISFNIYQRTLEYFELMEGIDKPVIIGEFHFGALDRGMFNTGLISVENQEERANAYKRYIESALKHPNVVGAHWFQYGDQAPTGRFDGENFQIGLVDVCDKPYPETIAKVKEVGYNLYKIRNNN